MDVEIKTLDIRLEVEGGDDEAAFVRLFEKYIGQWSRRAAEESKRRRTAASERSLGDGAGEDDE
ncbi:MAG: putative phage tail protein [Vicinamibacterales bacterium]